ncbi:MAG: bifunctional 2-C-methyl-D-erythritol 4-phosphate cytidylyltransferase/2-C-methyl-D-erythritol 2,4-cyclodiphosphate synthase [Pseudomonadota bacterium]
MDCAAIIVAAGRGVRAGGGVPKQYRPILGRPLLAHGMARLADHPRVASLVPVINPDDRALYEAALGTLLPAQKAKIAPPVPGGATRQASVRAGLEALADDPPKAVLVHDAARPFVPAPLVDALLARLADHEGAIAALAVSDSLKQGDGLIEAEVARAGMWRAQTPQAFRFDAILAAHRACAGGQDFTDDAAVARAAGHQVALVPGSEDLFKVTHAADFARAEAFIGAALGDVRTGQGFDVHRFTAGDHLWLCGVKIPHERGLEGHSDADAGLHALTDAILGAIGAGDIGAHFPPSDPQWRGAASDRFLAHASSLVAAVGGVVSHCDVTLICERPKIGPHRQAMCQRIAAIVGLDPARVSVKATTTEGLGFSGRREGLAALATATVRLPWSHEKAEGS